MTEFDIMEQLAAHAPTPITNYADLVLQRARRARMRRRIGWTAGAVTTSAAIVVAALLLPPGNPQLAPATPTPSVTVSESPVARSVEATVYATSIVRLAEAVREDGPPVRNLYILDHTCDNIISSPGNDTCHPQPLPATLRGELTAALVWYAPVHFVASNVEAHQPGTLTVINDGVLVKLGPAQISGDRALVPLFAGRNGFANAGLTYDLRKSGGAWVIVGTVGSSAVG